MIYDFKITKRLDMKKIIFTALILFSIKGFSQATYTDQAGKWRLGLNAGAMWQTSDVTPHAGIAGGFTIERILNKKADAFIGFALGLRYLSGNCTGLDTKPSYGVANNTVLNGTFDTTLNYAKHGGVFYNNYKTFIHEGALELKINFPRFEQKTNIIFHVFGGLGICNYKTWINALNVNGNMYDFSTLQNAQNVTAADVKKVLNGSYGTLAQGSSSTGTTTWLPSVGVGLGYKLSKHFSLVFEYRLSFPRTNLLDGVTYNMNNEPIRNNDLYNYASANLLFTIYGKQHKSSYNTTPVYTNANNNYSTPTQPINNTTVYNNNYSTPPVNGSNGYNSAPQVYPPYVNITYPANNYSSQGNYVSVQGNVQNIQSANQMAISQNGYPIKYFSYDPNSGNFNFQTFLQQGTNNIIVTANSPYGTGSQGVTVFYNPPYTPPSSGTVGTVYPNGNAGNNYTNNTYQNNTNQTVTINPNVVTPANPVNNNTPPHFGGTIVPVQLDVKPVVQFTNPYHSPEDVFNPIYNISATVQNVTLANQITVTINGNNIQQFNYNPSTKILDFTANLLTGFNSIHISATNAAGTDSKSTVIDYKPVGKPPRIDVFNPASNPYTSLQSNIIVNGYVYNVSSSSDITVNFDGNILTFNYNNNTHEIDIPVNLLNGSNQLNITANNSFGNDVKSLTLIYQAAPNFTVNPHTLGGNNNNQTQPTFTVNPHTFNGNQAQPTFTATQGNPLSNQAQSTFTVGPHTNIGNNSAQTFTATQGNPLSNQAQSTFTVGPHSNVGNNGTPTFTATEGNPLGNQGNTNTGNNTGAVNNNMGGGIHRQPEITLTSPQSTPYTTMSGVISISANLNYMFGNCNATVMYDGNQVSFSYNPLTSELLNFTSPLRPGMNTFVIKATNPYGTVTKNVDINYVPTNPNGNVNGNPSLHYSNGLNTNTNPPRGFNNTNVQPIKSPPVQMQNSQPQQLNMGRPRR